MKWIYLLSFLLINTIVARAQGEYSWWNRATIGYSLSKSQKLEAEFQYRRQNHLPHELKIDRPLFESFRLWYQYRLNDQFQLILSPLALMQHSQIDKNDYDLLSELKEIRFSAALQWKKTHPNNWEFNDRLGLESRNFYEINKSTWRLRNRVGLKRKITDHYSLSLSEEIFINTLSAQTSFQVDQNRVQVLNEIKILPKLKSEIGYLWIERYKSSTASFKAEHALVLNMHYQIN